MPHEEDTKTRLQICPSRLLETKPQMVPMDLNVGFQGLTLIQGQIYNPKKERISPNKRGASFKSIPNFFPVVFASEELVQEGDAHIVLSTYWLGAPRGFRCFSVFWPMAKRLKLLGITYI